MKIISTIHESYNMSWKVHVSPIGTLADSTKEERPIISYWSPDDNPHNKMLIYNPKITLVGKYKQGMAEQMYIPISQLYAFVNKLSVVYQGLSAEKLKKRDGHQLYLDQKEILKNSQKLSVFAKYITMSPTMMTVRDQELIGVQFTSGGKFAGCLPHYEVRELCEKLSHMDIQVYALILSLVERVEQLDAKVDTVIALQREILQLLKREEAVEKVKITPTAADQLQWTQLS